MTFTIAQSQLHAALSIAGKAVGGNRIIPILECVRFKINKSDCYLYGNNLKECIIKHIAIECNTITDIAINYVDLSGLVASLPDQPLTFDIKDSQVTIKANTGTYQLACEPGTDFPEPNDEVVATTTIQADDLNEGIFRTVSACSTDDLRPAFCGICMEFEKTQIRFMATDANVASIYTLSCDVGLNYTCILPANAAKIIQSLNLTGDVELKVTDNHLIVEQDGLIIYCTLIAEKFPPLKSVIPTNDFVLTINRLELLGAAKRVSRFAYQFVRFSLGKSVSIEAENMNFGKSAKEALRAQYIGDDLIIGTDPEWLIGRLDGCITDVVYLYFSAPKNAILIREVESAEKDNLMLCMPVWVAK